MKALAIFVVLLGCMAMVFVDQAPTIATSRAESVAANYVAYRNAVHLYAITHKLASGSVLQGDLILPPGWKPVRTWHNRISGGRMYVWGEASAKEAKAILDLVQGSLAVGVANSGYLENRHGHRVAPLPGFVPEKSVASVIVQPS